MSLKALHLVFVTLLTALAVAIGVWKTVGFGSSHSGKDLAFGLAAFIVALLVVWYGTRVFKKLKSISYL